MVEEYKLPIKDLSYIEFDVGLKKLFVVKHHTIIIKCLKKAYDEKLITKNSTLFHIDKHPDASFEGKNKPKSKEILNLEEKELNKFIQESLDHNNSEFIVPLMFSQLIKDTISIHYDSGDTYGTFVDETYGFTKRYYFSDGGVEHNFYVYETQDLSHLFGYQSLLSDTTIHQDTKKLFNDSESFILDIDLDYFTYQYDGAYAKNQKDIWNQINSDSFRRLIEKSSVILIALEPKFCGSNEDCLEILAVFQKLFESLFELDFLDIVKKKYLT